MLETLIKRNGTEEAFTNEKTNQWFGFAGKGIEDRIDWMSIVTSVVNGSPKAMSTQDYQKALIDACVQRGQANDGWPYMVMAGRLYTIWLMKKIHGDGYPTLRNQLRSLADMNLMRRMAYTNEEIAFLDRHIDHDANLTMVFGQVEQFHLKYSLRNRKTKAVLETPQFTMMRMAMASCEKDESSVRLQNVLDLYAELRDDNINPPTPPYNSLGTDHYGMASCCLIAAKDTATSIGVAGTVAYEMTVASAGLGIHLNTRTVDDPVDGGRVSHGGRLNYVNYLTGAAQANKQGMRGGALNIYGTIYDPEVEMMMQMQNPKTPEALRNRKLNVTIQDNAFFAKKAAKREKYFTFTCFSAPDLYDALFEADQTLFERLYAEYEANPNFVKNYRDAYDTLVMMLTQENEVSTLFWCNPSELNRHTSFEDRIWSANLCMEVAVATTPFEDYVDLYGDGSPEKGEVGICNIGSIPVNRFPCDPSNPTLGYAKYYRAVYQMLKMIDYAIDHSDYRFPAIEKQAKARRNASVGMAGVATFFAENNLKITEDSGMNTWHFMCERHAYAVISASLAMGQEKGNAPWMHRTKWPKGWLPIDTYKKAIDAKVKDHALRFDWEELRGAIIENKGIRHSSLIAHMPGEQSSRKGQGSNAFYPVHQLYVSKSDGSSIIPWAAKDNDLIGHQYELAWNIPHKTLLVKYGVLQKFTDQTGSFDIYEDRITNPELNADTLVDNYLERHRLGIPVKYYTRSLTVKTIESKIDETLFKAKAADETATQSAAVYEPEPMMCSIDGGGCTT